MRDGAHTHHGSGGAGLAGAVLAALVVAACSGAIAAAFTALVHLLLIVLAVLVGLAIAGGIVAAASTRLRRVRREHWLDAARSAAVSGQAPTASLPVRELAALHAEIAGLRQQLTDRPYADGGYHQHLHFHAADPDSVRRTIKSNGGDAR
jgi:hypothetical protein